MLQITQMQSEAAQRKAEVEKAAGDWRQQIDLLHKVVDIVNGWEMAFLAEFGFVVMIDAAGSRVTHHSSKGFGTMEPDYAKLHTTQWQFGPNDFIPARIEFQNGVGLVQTLVTKHEEQEVLVRYDVRLHIDENRFLTDLLPRTLSAVRPVHDPVYDILSIEIRIPKGELVKETLHTINERMSKPEPSAPSPKKGFKLW